MEIIEYLKISVANAERLLARSETLLVAMPGAYKYQLQVWADKRYLAYLRRELKVQQSEYFKHA